MYLDELNDQQRQAATSDASKILCLAGAGAGKTKTLIARIQHLIHDKKVDPRSILALTFTNAAAVEMKDRYKRLEACNSSAVPVFGTFHSFCYSLIIKDVAVRNKLGYTAVPEVCDDNKLKEIETKVKLQVNLSLSENELTGKKKLTRAQEEEKKVYLKALAKTLRSENLITFDIMCYNICDMFVRNLPEVDKYRGWYKYILVDEFQDTDTNQYEFIKSLQGSGSNVMFFADALQSIYQFRGCTNQYVKELANDPKCKVIKLFKNYRSTRQICDFANRFSTYAPDDYRITMEGQRDGDKVKIISGSVTSFNHPVCLNHLSTLKAMLQAHPVESAVLCRSNRECAAVRSFLVEAGIQFSAQTKASDALDILKSALSNEYMRDWLAAKLDAKQYADYIRLSSLTENPDIRWFLHLYGQKEAIKKLTDKIAEIRTLATEQTDPNEKFTKIVEKLRVTKKCEFSPDMISNEDIVNGIITQIEEYDESQVYVGTIHSSKGLEYDSVYVMGVDDNQFILGNEEMNNLYYVAITRAKNHLTVFRR